MTEWLIAQLPILGSHGLLSGTALILFTSVLFLLKIESVSKRLEKSSDKIPGDSDQILSRLLFPLCTALPNFIFAISAVMSSNKNYLVITSNVGNNVTNVTIFVGFILAIGYLKKENFKDEQSDELRKDYNFLLISTIIFFACIWDGTLTRQEGIVLTACFFYSLTDVFRFQFKDLILIISILFKLVPFFLVSGFFMFVGSELIIGELDDMKQSSNLYDVLLPGLILVLPSILPLMLTILKKDMQKLALSGIIGDCAFSVPLIIGIVSCFHEKITLPNPTIVIYMLITSAIAFFCFNMVTNIKGKVPLWKVLIPFLGYGLIVLFSLKDN
ncbi:MAG: hypothetical protein COA79_01840 [Planctomycetota bacterium]|nr:MAG: hypothetical protein COA79_01840 [Planctomycetota bacterium]